MASVAAESNSSIWGGLLRGGGGGEDDDDDDDNTGSFVIKWRRSYSFSTSWFLTLPRSPFLWNRVSSPFCFKKPLRCPVPSCWTAPSAYLTGLELGEQGRRGPPGLGG